MNPIDRYQEKLDPERAAMLHYLRQLILAENPHLTERIAYGLPFIYGHKGICYFNQKKTGIDVGFMYGIHLPQRPEFLFEGRKQVRSLFFPLREEIKPALLLAVVKDALALDAQKKASAL